jgi:hypothetical protein
MVIICSIFSMAYKIKAAELEIAGSDLHEVGYYLADMARDG